MKSNNFKAGLAFLILLLCNGLVKSQNINRPNIQGPDGLRVNAYTGNLYLDRNDILIKARKINLDISFYYNSNNYLVNVGFGNGWSFNYAIRYVPDSNGVHVVWGDGRDDKYIQDSINNSILKSPKGFFDHLTQYQSGKYKLTAKNKWEYFFDDAQHKKITKIAEPNGNHLLFGYTDSMLTSVTDASGRSVQLVYSAGMLINIIDANGPQKTISYLYDSYGNLTGVTDPLGHTEKYQYIVNGPLSVYTDKNENATDVIYNPQFGVSEIISCNSRMAITYNKATLSTFVVNYMTSSENRVTSYRFNDAGNLIRKQGNCCGYNVVFAYDNDNNISKMTDANGFEYNYQHDNKGNLILETDPLGNAMTYSYDTVFNYVATSTDKKGNLTSYNYDNRGNLLSINHPLGISEHFSYAANGDLLTYTDAKNNTTGFTYDTYGNPTTITRPLSSTVSMTFDLRSRLISSTDPRGNTSTFIYDLNDRLISTTDALNHPTTLTYDANGNRTSITDANGNVTVNAYDALDRLVTVTNALGKSSIINYDEQSNITSLVDENGHPTLFAYDNLNRVISVKNAMNEIHQYAYDGNGNMVSLSLPNGNTITNAYDALNRLISSSDDLGSLIQNAYDKNDNLLSESDGNTNTTNYAYDALNRRIAVTDPMGNATNSVFDPNNNLLSQTDRNGRVTQYTYDALNRMTSTIDPLGNVTGYGYDAVGNLITVTDPNSNSTAFSYDVLNRQVSETHADGSSKQLTYDAVGNLLSRTDGNGNLTSYTYDVLNRLTGINYPGTDDHTFTYDFSGNMLSAVNAAATIQFTYDLADRLLSEALNGKITAYTYNTLSGFRDIIYPGGRTIKNSYDLRDRLESVSEGSKLLAHFNYDVADRMTASGYMNNTTANMSYDANNRVISMINNPAAFLNLNYSYDNEDNKLYEKKVHQLSASEQYLYDNAYRLTGFKRGSLSGNSIPSPVHQVQYNYDAAGNRILMNANGNSTFYTANNVNNYTQINNGVPVTPAYDANGNLTNDGIHTLSYDFENRMTTVDGGNTARFFYDALGRRIRKITPLDTINYYFNSDRVIEERNGSDQTIATYTYGTWIDALLTMNRGGQEYYYHTNNLGSVYAVTDSMGNVAERYQYDAFGAFDVFNAANLILSNTSIGNHYTFTGRDFNPESGRFNYRNRTYNALAGRFEQRDPIGIVGGVNTLAYVENNPLNYSDPLGLSPSPCNDNKFDPKSLIPIYGNYKDAQKACNAGDYKWCAFYTGMAISDVFLVKAIAVGLGKMAVKGGASLMAKQAAKSSGQGGLNLFKWGAEQTGKSTGWKAGDYMLHLPNKGTPALNWKANYGALRREMNLGKPIFDSYRLSNGNLIPTGGFLNAERAILQGRGWIYNAGNGAWMPPRF